MRKPGFPPAHFTRCGWLADRLHRRATNDTPTPRQEVVNPTPWLSSIQAVGVKLVLGRGAVVVKNKRPTSRP